MPWLYNNISINQYSKNVELLKYSNFLLCFNFHISGLLFKLVIHYPFSWNVMKRSIYLGKWACNVWALHALLIEIREKLFLGSQSLLEGGGRAQNFSKSHSLYGERACNFSKSQSLYGGKSLDFFILFGWWLRCYGAY